MVDSQHHFGFSSSSIFSRYDRIFNGADLHQPLAPNDLAATIPDNRANSQ
jgi:hypothetical protein